MKKYWLRMSFLGIMLFISVTLISCSGPVSLTSVISPSQENAYTDALKKHKFSPKDSYWAWKAQETALSPEELSQRDQQISTTRNPFNARKDDDAVARGAMLYKAHCMACHGENVDGCGPLMRQELPKLDFHSFGKRFAVTLHNGAPKSWFRKIHGGTTSEVKNSDGTENVMPAFGDQMAREQIWLTITYLQSLDAYSRP